MQGVTSFLFVRTSFEKLSGRANAAKQGSELPVTALLVHPHLSRLSIVEEGRLRLNSRHTKGFVLSLAHK